MNCTRIDDITLDSKEQKELNNLNIKKLSEMTSLSDIELTQSETFNQEADDEVSDTSMSNSLTSRASSLRCVHSEFF